MTRHTRTRTSRPTVADRMNRPALAASALVAFGALAAYSRDHTAPHGYAPEEVAAMDALIARVVAPQTVEEKLEHLFLE